MIIKLAPGGILHCLQDGDPTIQIHLITPYVGDSQQSSVTVSPGFMPPGATTAKVDLQPHEQLIPFAGGTLALGIYYPPFEELWGGGSGGQGMVALATVSSNSRTTYNPLNLPRNPFTLTLRGLTQVSSTKLGWVNHHLSFTHGDPFSGMGPSFRVWKEVALLGMGMEPTTTVVPVWEEMLIGTSYLKNNKVAVTPERRLARISALNSIYQGMTVEGATESPAEARRRLRLEGGGGGGDTKTAKAPELPLATPEPTDSKSELLLKEDPESEEE